MGLQVQCTRWHGGTSRLAHPGHGAVTTLPSDVNDRAGQANPERFPCGEQETAQLAALKVSPIQGAGCPLCLPISRAFAKGIASLAAVGCGAHARGGGCGCTDKLRGREVLGMRDERIREQGSWPGGFAAASLRDPGQAGDASPVP